MYARRSTTVEAALEACSALARYRRALARCQQAAGALAQRIDKFVHRLLLVIEAVIRPVSKRSSGTHQSQQQRRREHSPRRAKRVARAAVEFGQQCVGACDLRHLVRTRYLAECRMAVGVIAETMTLRDHARDQLGMAFDVLANQKETRPRAMSRQNVQHSRGVVGVRSIIESQIAHVTVQGPARPHNPVGQQVQYMLLFQQPFHSNSSLVGTNPASAQWRAIACPASSRFRPN